MSKGNTISLSLSRRYTARLKELLGPGCQRLEVAGSVRRGCPEVGDIDLVVIPRLESLADLLGQPTGSYSLLDEAITTSGLQVLKGGEHHKQLDLKGGHICELWICTPETYGVQLLIRTGCADFSHWIVTARAQGGGCPYGMKVKDGLVWEGERVIPTLSEEEVFSVLNLPFVALDKREKGYWNQVLTRKVVA